MKLFLGDREGLNLRGVPLRISLTFSWGSQIAIYSAEKNFQKFFLYKIECNSGNSWTSTFLFSVLDTLDCWLQPAFKIFQLSGIPSQ